jgi:hypothetical protein
VLRDFVLRTAALAALRMNIGIPESTRMMTNEKRAERHTQACESQPAYRRSGRWGRGSWQ